MLLDFGIACRNFGKANGCRGKKASLHKTNVKITDEHNSQSEHLNSKQKNRKISGLVYIPGLLTDANTLAGTVPCKMSLYHKGSNNKLISA